MSELPNWVERRAQSERTLNRDAPVVWNEVRSALQDACDSYNHNYCPETPQVTCKLENGNRVLITKVLQGTDRLGRPSEQRSDIVVAFDANTCMITSTRTKPGGSKFIVTADERNAFILAGAE